jgi:hypothetical protein
MAAPDKTRVMKPKKRRIRDVRSPCFMENKGKQEITVVDWDPSLEGLQ